MQSQRLQVVSLLCFIVLFLGTCKLSTESKFKFDYPLLNDVSKATSLSCQGIVFSGIWSETKNIEGEVSKATDKLAVAINDENTMSLMTQASVAAGIAEPAKFDIFKNDERTLLAAQLIEGPLAGSSVNSFALDKNTGLAIWSKNYSQYPQLNKPVVQNVYLRCK